MRQETAQAVSVAKLSSDDPVAGKAVNGDTVTLDLTATEPITQQPGPYATAWSATPAPIPPRSPNTSPAPRRQIP
ncbi:hypothetical protein [Streptacidiphilus sp. EB103A]|uniref:hypothetical protein n=1 Tax=Streptacidiphilus sp. EB103A TaxID=3156275 RepID=UPI0035173BA8